MIDSENFEVEQPNYVHDQGEEISQKNEMGQDEIGGSTFGKFKNSKALLDAYNNLQSEFTKKCQALAKMQNVDNVKTPIYLQEDWGEKIDCFVNENPEAKDYVDEIVSVIKNDKIENEENPILVAWNKVATKNFKSPKNLVLNKDFLEKYVFNNENIKNEIIERYIEKINNISSPRIMGGGEGAKVILTPNAKPKTIQEAGIIAREMLK